MEHFEATLNIVGDTSRRLARRELRGLSDIGRENEAAFSASWSRIDLLRRREIVRAMRDLAEDNVDFDFRDVLTACLGDTDPEVRQVAVEGLWDDDRPRTMRQLLDMLANDSDDGVRAAVALALGRYSYRAALDELREDDAARLRAALIAAAGNLDLDVDVRRRAVESSGYFNGPDIDAIIAGAYGSGDDRLKTSAVAAIGHTLDQRWLPILRAELASPVPALRYEAARATGELGEEARALIAELLPLATGDDVEIYTAAIWAIGQIGGDAAHRILRQLAEDDDPARQAAAGDALGELDFDADPFRLI